VTIHHIKSQNNAFFTAANAASGDTFVLQGKGATMGLDDYHLADAKIRFLGKNQSATIIEAGTGMKIYDQGHGTNLTFTFAIAGVVTIYDFQHDKTGHITYLNTATTQGHLTPSSDGHGGTWLTGAGLTLHLVNDPHIAASQHS
jgi:hypothetical protein